MLKSCKYCMKIHDANHTCLSKAKAQKEYYTNVSSKQKEIILFRGNREWVNKRADIIERDIGMCQVCVRKLYDTTRQFNGYNIQVHHIVPLAVDWSKRLENNNLITLCTYHHALAECGDIPMKQLLFIVQEQEQSFDNRYSMLASRIIQMKV